MYSYPKGPYSVGLPPKISSQDLSSLFTVNVISW